MDISRGTWSDAGMSPSLNHLVERLIHKKEYHFRVKAVNAMGESEPLETTKATIAQNEFGKYFKFSNQNFTEEKIVTGIIDNYKIKYKSLNVITFALR